MNRHRTKLKICGLTNIEDALLAAELGADYGGFVFHSPSPRAISVPAAAEIVRTVRSVPRPPSCPMSLVGVFVNEDIPAVRRIYSACGLDIIQLHGNETPDYCRELRLPFWKAVRARNESAVRAMDAFPGSVFLIDAYARGRSGGTGKRLDPHLARLAVASGRRVVLAGGVSAGNLTEFLALRPFAVDVSTSLEERPGKKSRARMREFFAIFNEWKERS